MVFQGEGNNDRKNISRWKKDRQNLLSGEKKIGRIYYLADCHHSAMSFAGLSAEIVPRLISRSNLIPGQLFMDFHSANRRHNLTAESRCRHTSEIHRFTCSIGMAGLAALAALAALALENEKNEKNSWDWKRGEGEEEIKNRSRSDHRWRLDGKLIFYNVIVADWEFYVALF